MKKKYLLSITVNLFVTLSAVIGQVSGNGTVLPAGDLAVLPMDPPLNHHWEIPAGQTNTIPPGTILNFPENTWLEIWGTLKADGTTGEIKLTGQNWQGLRFVKVGIGSFLTKCIIEFGVADDNDNLDWLKDGGGIYFTECAVVILTECTISNNKAKRNGGGIYCKKSSPVFDKCKITLNDAQIQNDGGNGGGIYCIDESKPTLQNQTFVGNVNEPNTAWRGYGGGIYCENESDLTIKNSSIIYNEALQGGGLYSLKSTPQITDTKVNRCHAIDNLGLGVEELDGGGIYLLESPAKIEGNCIIGPSNTAMRWGGGIYIKNCIPVIKDCQITENSAGKAGGGVYMHEVDNIIVLNACLINKNHVSDGDGGGIYVKEIKAEINKCEILDNWSENGNGGGIYINNSPECRFVNNNKIGQPDHGNKALSGDGGGVYIHEGKISISSCEIIANYTQTTGNGGGIYLNKTDCELKDCKIGSKDAENFTAENGSGGGIYINEGKIKIKSCEIVANYTGNNGNGGGICINKSPDCEIEACKIGKQDAANKANNGGGLAIQDNSKVILKNNTISYNEVSWNGGGVYVLSSQLSMNTTKILNCKAPGALGGGMYCDKSTLDTESGEISNNSGAAGGGIYFSESDDISIKNVEFIENKGLDGCVLYFKSSNPTKLFDVLVWKNKFDIGLAGGAITCDNSNPKFTTSTIAWNQGPALVINNSAPEFNSCIVYFNNKDLGIQGLPEGLNVTYTCNQSNPVYLGVGNINDDPGFGKGRGEWDILPSVNGNVNPCMNTGDPALNNNSLPQSDIFKDTRLIERVDMGVAEIQPQKLSWKGVQNNDWCNASNWNPPSVPTNGPVEIRAVKGFMPVIYGSCNATTGKLIIYPGVTLTIEPNGTLTTQGLFTSDGCLIINEGSLIDLSDIEGTGSFQYDRYISPESNVNEEEWHLISTPVDNTVSGDFTGYLLKRWDRDIIPPAPPTLPPGYWVDVDPCGTGGAGCDPPSMFNVPIEMLKGYSIKNYYPCDEIPGVNAIPSTGETIEFGGDHMNGIGVPPPSVPNATSPAYMTNINTGDMSMPLNGASNWVLLGNPYPSGWDYDAFYFGPNFAAANINDAIYFWDGTLQQYASYVLGVGNNGGSNEVPPTQGFFLDALGPGTMTMTNAERIHTGVPFWKADPTNTLRLKVQGNERSDETVIRFREDATTLFDGHFDAKKLFSISSSAPSLYTKTDYDLAINSMPATDAVPVYFKAGAELNYTLTATTDMGTVYLEDKINGAFHNLSSPYTFSHATDNREDRFVVHFSLSTEMAENGFAIYSFAHNIFVNNLNNEKGTIAVYTLLGEEVTRVQLTDGLNILPMSETNTIYVVKVLGNTATASEKVYIR
jgi:predicted outer membrane repeat protein